MLKKQKKSVVYLLASLSIACSQQILAVPAQTNCAAVTCLVGSTCVNGICIPNQGGATQLPGNLVKHDPCYPRVTSPAGCIESCKTPEFANCKDMIFPLLFDPKFCGYNSKENRWIDYTFNCQACADDDVIGFIASKCNCSLTGCAQKQSCNLDSGLCEPIKEQPKCSNEVPNIVQCVNRPTKQECPDIFYIRAPDLNKCGVNKEGKRFGFARDCEVCIDPNFDFFYEDFCENVPQKICEDFEFCTLEGDCLDRCATIRCSSGFECKKGACIPLQEGKCHSDENCKSNEFCNNGQCLDNCARILCTADSTCIKGECVPITPPDECKGQCKDYERCFQGQCRDQCEFLRCAGCFKGQCGVLNNPEPISPPTDECKGKCKDYERCFQGECRDQCEFLRCAGCYKGQCGVFFEPECKKDYECGFGSKCLDGKCVDKCQNVKCEQGYECKYGSCYRSLKLDNLFGRKFNTKIEQSTKVYKGYQRGY